MMRSFSSRADCAVSDEPFYGAYLKTSGAPHAMAAEIMADMDCYWHSVAATMRGPAPRSKPVWYQKHMTHHMVGPTDIMDFPDHVHAFLIRDPDLMVASYLHKNELVDAEQLGFGRLVDYHKRISDYLGRAAPVVDANDILANPAGLLPVLCAAIGISWDRAMFGWHAGRHPCDGIWASHWYHAVEKSTGFGAPTAFSPLACSARAIAEQCRADYDYLAGFKLMAIEKGA